MGELKNIALIGLGLVGASFAATAHAKLPEVSILGVDVSEEARCIALEKGWVTQACSPQDPKFKEFVEQSCDLVLIAAPVTVIREYFELIDSWNYSGIISDTASTKMRISEIAEEVLRVPEMYIPGHPMAGSEKNGIEGARPDLFQGAHWILCPNEETPAENFQRLHELITSLGARVVSLPREDHDEAVAIVSHVPHFIASALVELATRHADDQQALFRLAAGGFKDSTRIAAGSPKLWSGIAFDNAEAVSAGLSEMQEIIGQFNQALLDGNAERMTELLREAADARKALPTAWVPSTERLLEVRIPMEDRKGVIAEATTIASQAGCNIQSIEIDHITEDTAVLSLVLTDEGDIGHLSSKLIEAGFSVSFSPLTPKEYAHAK
ncbi:MAG: prephenate dehydrogenase/arogenate dehydrogenase family protein [Raoultibacter sp.]